MTQAWRLAQGGAIDRTRPLAFTFDGVRYEGYAGDTLASALLANGVHLVGRSFKYHRPRGIFSAGVEEPNALVQLGTGRYTEPNTRATTIDLHEGLVATSQNCWPSVRFDVGEIANLLSPLLPAGFYYKTFKWPPSPAWWMRYEHFIRRAGGMGRSADAPDPARYDRQFAHCDVLVVGSGPAGVAAAITAAEAGASVIVTEQATDAATHGLVYGLGNASAGDVAAPLALLHANPRVTLLVRTTTFGYYDANLVGAVEHLAHEADASPDLPRQRLWLIRAKAVVLASGATERPIAYGNNDLPGTLLAGAAATYVQRYAVRLGTRAVVFTNNDGAYDTALALHAAGIEVAAVVDTRREPSAASIAVRERAGAANLALYANAVIARAHGHDRVARVDVASRSGGKTTSIDCDVVAISGGYSPVVHLFSQARGQLRYDADSASFRPDRSPMAIETAGAVNGGCDAATAAGEGRAAARRALARVGIATASGGEGAPRLPVDGSTVSGARTKVDPLWAVPDARGAKCFVDLQNDVTVRDVALARREGYQAVEHLKRYTTLGMGTDQGKTSNVVGIGLMGDALGVPMAAVGTTTFRPPYTPVTLGAFVGPHGGAHAEPTRYGAIHAWHAERGARFVDAGLWKRPHSYPRAGESEDDAANREARNVRENVGVVDVSTLGKIELQGRDVAEFLNRIYINRWDNLQVGRCRYGVMLREDGIVRDDGTTSRLDDSHYLMTTTTANAVAIMQTIERLLQIDWPDLDVHATSVTEQWTAAALSGPRSREVLARVVDIDVSNDAFPFLAVVRCNVRTADGLVPARLFRMSYSGELAYEIHVDARRGLAMWEAVLAAGEPFGIMPYGTEAMSTLRIEKGHVVIGAEIDGRTTAADLGMEKLVNPNKWCIGKPLLARPALTAPDRWQLVGLRAEGGARIPRGAKIVADPDAATPIPMQGHVTSWCYSPNLGAWIALALVANGRARHGETVWATSPLAGDRARVTIGSSTFIDPAGERLRG
ncbi:MAG TPA: sarcosine oxidase subunit alpha family protein [Casimicrobiaceae bacterium]|nr:sarcosine oxidase subunit alpha family protein [Casimicrobiaceae bacterium]